MSRLVARLLVDATEAPCYNMVRKEMVLTRRLGVFAAIALAVCVVMTALFIALIVLAVRALLKYLRSGEIRKEKAEQRMSLAQVLKKHRQRCKMTQEFVADAIGVSRQAVSKWESGASEPSTTNLCALAKLYGVPAEEMLRAIAQE